MGSRSRARSSGMTAMRSKCGTAPCARSSIRRASSTYIKQRKLTKSTGGLEQTVANGNAEAMVSRHWANDDSGPGCIQFAQSRKQATRQFFLIFQITPFVNQVGPFAGEHGWHHHANHLPRSL